MKTSSVCSVIFWAASIACCQESQGVIERDEQPTITLPSDLGRVLEDYERAWRKGDSQALAELFTEDGFVLSPGSPMVRGRREIAKHYGHAGGPLLLRSVAFSSDGTVGLIIGAFSDRPGNTDRGKFTLTLRRDRAGKWLIFSDMDNGNIPQPDCRPVSH
jgi:ketosteroid isomerase-like protein